MAQRTIAKDYFGRGLHSPEESRAQGKALRDKVPRESHAQFTGDGRPDPVDIVLAANKGRLQELVPIRHGRMLLSPLAFLRGTAAVMASDLSRTPVTGIRVQACGDCHLNNFGAFGTPERQMNFDINDFDETIPAPWEWDVKRLAVSFVTAGREIGLKERDCLATAESVARSYRNRMARYAEMLAFDVWYDHIDIEQVVAAMPPSIKKTLTAELETARLHTVGDHCFPKLVEHSRGRPRIKDDPPLIFHLPRHGHKDVRSTAIRALRMYRRTLDDHRRVLLDRFRLFDLAVKVVGVGSVGRMCMIMLFMATDNDPLFLQIKQANASVLEPYAGKSAYSNHGERIVVGQRLMQSAGDMMLGWTAGNLAGRNYYLRQLHDMKYSPELGDMGAAGLRIYAKLCGWTLARAHARSGDPAMISGYLGNSDVFDQAIVNFTASYSDQIESDYQAMRLAADQGRLKVAVVD
jgi:uncharacterized protein (DUF2252 family)